MTSTNKSAFLKSVKVPKRKDLRPSLNMHTHKLKADKPSRYKKSQFLDLQAKVTKKVASCKQQSNLRYQIEVAPLRGI